MHIKKLALQDFQVFFTFLFHLRASKYDQVAPCLSLEGSVFDIIQSFIYNKFIYG